MHRIINLFFLIVLLHSQAKAQNDVYLTSLSGKVFQVTYLDSLVNRKPEATVVLKNVVKDTIQVLIKTQAQQDTVTLYLLEKRKPVKNKEFLYEILETEKGITAKYSSVHERSGKKLVVARPPSQDTSYVLNEAEFLHFAELSNGKVNIKNNVPEKGCDSAMSAEFLSYSRLLISRGKVEDEKLKLSENIVQNNCLSILQLQSLVELFPYELDRVKLVKKAAPNVVDKKNYPQLKKSFKFESAYKHVESYFTGVTKEKNSRLCEVAASEAEINRLVDQLKISDNDGLRLQIMKEHQKDHCYSTTQARQVLRAFIHDRDRLEAAKLMFGASTERRDFSKLEDEFNYPQWRDEFKELIHNSAR